VAVAFTDRYRVKLRILDEDYTLVSPALPAHLERLALTVDQKMRQMIAKEPRLSVTRAAVMTAITYVDQSLRQEERCSQLEQQLAEQRQHISRLENELSRYKSQGGSRKGRR
jgi:cell division protein ZapA